MIKHNEYLLVEVQEESSRFNIVNSLNPPHFEWEYPVDGDDPGTYDCVDLPPGTYQLIGLAAELTEEQKKGICIPVRRPSEPVYYKLYNEPEDEQGDTPVATTDVNRAFLSLLRSHNLKPETTVVIKEIEK